MISPNQLQPKLVDASVASRKTWPNRASATVSDYEGIPLRVVPGIERLNRNCKLNCSVNRKFLNSPVSQLLMPGKFRMPRPELPRNPAAGCLNACVLNHLAMVGVMLACRIPDKIGPVGAKGVVEASHVGGRDGHGESAWNVTMPFTCQPPMM